MSTEKSFFGKIIAAILSVFAENWETFVAKLWRKVPDELQDKVSIGVRIVENLKVVIDSPMADVVTSIIPGDLDDKLKEYLRVPLPKILEKYGSITTISNKTAHNIATDINQDLTGLSYGQAALTTEVAYQSLKNA